mmetsp:Transcript_87287/g.250111  ORF Transcript_87287/g.250111 Transcript_87287/m.250111 type:complete len:253 (-) Transcript_87287:183-941(-)
MPPATYRAAPPGADEPRLALAAKAAAPTRAPQLAPPPMGGVAPLAVKTLAGSCTAGTTRRCSCGCPCGCKSAWGHPWEPAPLLESLPTEPTERAVESRGWMLPSEPSPGAATTVAIGGGRGSSGCDETPAVEAAAMTAERRRGAAAPVHRVGPGGDVAARPGMTGPAVSRSFSKCSASMAFRRLIASSFAPSMPSTAGAKRSGAEVGPLLPFDATGRATQQCRPLSQNTPSHGLLKTPARATAQAPEVGAGE